MLDHYKDQRPLLLGRRRTIANGQPDIPGLECIRSSIHTYPGTLSLGMNLSSDPAMAESKDHFSASITMNAGSKCGKSELTLLPLYEYNNKPGLETTTKGGKTETNS